MQDRIDNPGRTRWRRFAAMMVAAGAVTGVMMFGLSSGALAANITVSGQTFKIGAERLEGDDFKQYGGIVREKDGKVHPVAISEIGYAELTKLCQSVRADLPGLPVVLTINAGGDGKPATAKGMLIAMDDLGGNATFTKIKIGRDATDLNPSAKEGSFGQNADHVTITGLEQTARYTTAGTFNLTGLRLKVNVGDDAKGKECY
ncbi:cholesterol esterase [Micromonospora sp. ATA32]|nr:cholesterol esterase [Micromonospora sp. ATA32]